MFKKTDYLYFNALRKVLLTVVLLFFTLGLSYSYISEDSKQLGNEINQIDSFLTFVDKEKSDNEKLLEYERKKLLEYKDYVDEQMAEHKSKLKHIDTVLEFIDKKYKTDKFSTFVNKRVEDNKAFNVKLKEYTRLRSIILNDLVILKEAEINIRDTLNHVSNQRIYIRNEFRFEQSNVLWQVKSWKHLFNDITFNETLIFKEIAYFFGTLLFYFLLKKPFTNRSFIDTNRLKNKAIVGRAVYKLNGFCELIFSTILYPIIALFIVCILYVYGVVVESYIYTVSVCLQVIVIYSFLIYILEYLAEVVLSKVTKLMFIFNYCLFGLTIHLFGSNLYEITSTIKAVFMPLSDSIVLGFITMLLMLVPAICLFINLKKYLGYAKTGTKKIIQVARYFTVFSLMISIFMMTLGGYPNLGMSSSFDLYQSFFWGVYIYIGYKLVCLLIGIILSKKTKLILIRNFAETIIGGVKRSGIKYWLKSLAIIIAYIVFFIFLLLSFNIQSERIEDMWDSFFYEGVNIFGINLIPLSDFLESLSILVVIYFVAKFILLFVSKRIFPYTKLDMGTKEAISSIIKYIFIIIAVVLFIKSLGISNTAITFIASGLSVGLGFAMQDLVKNFFAGLVMLIERPVKIGDWVNIENQIGVVKRISIRATEVLTFDNNSLIVPNHLMITNIVSNETLDPTSRLVLPIRVSYDEDFEKVLSICKNAIESDCRIFSSPEPEYLLNDYGESSFILSVRAYCPRLVKIYILSDLRIKILQELKANNIDIPFSKMDIYVNNLDDKGRLIEEKY